MSEKKYKCPKCGKPLKRIRLWNPDIFGIDDKKNPYIGWICVNPKCKGWYCEYCEEWHPYGTSCGTAAVRNLRSGTNYPIKDPNWKHKEDIKR